jgi:hypothetical protein
MLHSNLALETPGLLIPSAKQNQQNAEKPTCDVPRGAFQQIAE